MTRKEDGGGNETKGKESEEKGMEGTGKGMEMHGNNITETPMSRSDRSGLEWNSRGDRRGPGNRHGYGMERGGTERHQNDMA